MEQVIQQPVINNNDWFKHWFDSSFYHKLYAHRDEKEASGFIDRLLKTIEPAPGARMLDLGCGNGRHSKYLAGKGFNVTGMDLAASSIQTAKQAATAGAAFYRHDMRAPFGKNCFDHVFSFFTSFGYFKTNREDEQVMSNIAASLKPGGTLLLDYINSAWAEQQLVPAEIKEIDGIAYQIARWHDSNHFFKKITIDTGQPAQPFEYVEQVKKFRLYELDELLCRHGLQLQQVFGDYHLNGYNNTTSPRLILLAIKK